MPSDRVYEFILSYSQILSAVQRNRVRARGVDYLMPPELKDFVEDHLPEAGSMFVDGQYLLVAVDDEEDGPIIVAFSPGGPPDPG